MAKIATVPASPSAVPAPKPLSLRIGITGVSGFIGRAVLEAAREAGHESVGFSRSPERVVPGTVEMREFSRPELADYSKLDAVIHLAGESVFGLWTAEKKRLIFESRYEGTRSLVRGIEKMRSTERPATLVAASGISLYGDTGDDRVDEDADVGFSFLAEVTRAWEAAVREASDIGLRSVSCRIGLVLGLCGGALPIQRRLIRAFLGGRLGSGRQWTPWIHIRDLARILIFCVENNTVSGAVNAVGPNPVTNREYTETLARVLGRPAFLPAPAFVLKRLPGGMGEIFLHGQRADPAALRMRGFRWEFPDLEPALRNLLPPPHPKS